MRWNREGIVAVIAGKPVVERLEHWLGRTFRHGPPMGAKCYSGFTIRRRFDDIVTIRRQSIGT
jgi:hypothetical protein